MLSDRLAAEAPFASVDAVIARAETLLEAMNERDRIAVLDAHPRIGADRRTLSPDSAREQGDQDDPGLLRQLAQLNEAYEELFGFRFIVFVAGRRKAELLPIMRERMTRARDAELATGLAEFLAISRDRLRRG